MAPAPLRRPSAVKSEQARVPGFFGKLPTRGDFVARRFDGRIRTLFDEWLSASLVASRKALGETWTDLYAHAPSWRFVLTGGIAGSDPVAGLMMPSRDNYGRQFPIVIATDVPGCRTPLQLVHTAEAWFAAAERAALSGVHEGADFDAFEGRVTALGQPVFTSDRTAPALRFPGGDALERARAFSGALEATLGNRQDEVSLWWTAGGGGVSPSMLHHQGMPPPERFAALLDGRWEDWGWMDMPAAGATGEAEEVAAPHGGPLRSAARSHRGTRRTSNQDASLERVDLGLWAVADGAGGHDAGAYASALVIAKLAEFQVPMSFGAALTEIEELLEEANDSLCSKGRQLGPERICAAVVVILFVHKGQFAAVWAGDSRAYLRRDGRLQRITRDHVSDGGRFVTRAIGAEPNLLVDVARGEIRPGDRFVLCSDGLVKTIGDRLLEAAVRRGDAAEVAGELIEDALIAGAGDNVTVLVVDVEG